MINFNLHAFVLAMALLEQESAIANVRAIYARDKEGPDKIQEDDLARFRQNLTNGIAPPLNALFIGEGRLGDLATIARLGGAYEDLAHELHALRSDIRHASQFERFYHYRKDRGLLLITKDADWATVLTAFPSTRRDVDAAVDCYALEHPDASIYHCMMILERGLPALAKRIGARFKKERPTWKDMTDAIRSRIDARRNALMSPPRGSRPLSKAAAKKERELLETAGEAAIEFKFFEHAWRNHIAHGRAAYDENDAKKVLEHVRTFMEVIATKLKLREQR
jgi:hypothetical protein